MNTTQVKLTPTMRSALECRDGGGLDPLTDACWNRAASTVEFASGQRDALFAEIMDAANSEDFCAERGDYRARRASTALSNLASRVLRA